MNLTGVPRGSYLLTVTAIEAFGASGVHTIPLLVDRPPAVVLVSPASGALARPVTHVTAQCTDDDACAQLRLTSQSGAVLATEQSRIDQDVSLATFEGTLQKLSIQATDTVGQTQTITFDVYVDSSVRLAEVAALPGPIQDFDATRILYQVNLSTGTRVVIRDRASGQDTIVNTYSGDVEIVARLTAAGALINATDGPPPAPRFVDEWRSGTLTQIAAISGLALDVDGDYAVFGGPLFRYRVSDRTLQQVPSGGENPDVTANGSGAFSTGSLGGPLVHRFDEALNVEMIAAVAPRASTVIRPVTDGVKVVYAHHFTGPAFIKLWQSGVTETLASSVPVNGQRQLYQIEGDWLAFVRPGTAGQLQVWRRSAAGVETQVTFLLQSSLLDHLAPGGDLTYTNNGRTYLVQGTNPHVDIASALGQSYFRGGRWYVVIGHSLLTVVPSGSTDADGDALPDVWERQFGLDIALAGANADPDGDGRTNAQEFAAGTHPRGFVTRHFAEGATSSFFESTFALLNTSTVSDAEVLLRYQKGDGTSASTVLSAPPLTRRTVTARDQPGLAAAEFSTIVESDEVVVADRKMTWDARGYGSHAETATMAPATDWYLAEGATHSGFNLFYLIQNPGTAAASVTVTYLLQSGGPVQKVYTVPATSRFNIWVNNEATSLPALVNANLSARLQSNVPVIIERAMYLDTGGLTFGAGHDSAGVTAPALTWFLAEGATGTFFDLFVLVANPNSTASNITVRFLLDSGTVITKSYTVAANSRFNIYVDGEDAQLADAAVSTTVTVTNGVPVIVERAMWWPGPTAATWHEAHNSPGVTQTGTKWALADGEQGGARSVQTYILVANTSSTASQVLVTLLFEDGTQSAQSFSVPATSRFNVDVGARFANTAGKRFGAIVESLDAAQIVVEGAMYSNADGVVWAAGTNAVATRLQ